MRCVSPWSGRIIILLASFSDIVFKIRQPVLEEVSNFRDQGTLYSFIYPAQNKEVIDKLAAKKMTVFGESLSPLGPRKMTWVKGGCDF